MDNLNDRQIWRTVFDGNIQQALIWTRVFRSRTQPLNFTDEKRNQALALYLEPSLVSNSGHQLTLANCYKQLLTKLGYSCLVVHAFKSSIPQQTGWLPYFLVKHHTIALKNISTADELENVEGYFREEFDFLIKRFHPSVCIFSTIRFTNIVAAVKAVISNRVQKTVFGIMEAESVPDCFDSEIVKSAFSQAATLLQKQQWPHILIAETEYVKEFLLDCGFKLTDIKVFPYVGAKLITDCQVPHENASGKKIRIGYLGSSRPVRHPELIVDLIFSGLLPETVELCAQLDLNYFETSHGKKVCEKLVELDKEGAIGLYPANLSTQSYRALFHSLDFVILPYGTRYEQIGSGVFIEAICTQVTPILPRDSKLYNVYVSLSGDPPCFKELSAASIATAITDTSLASDRHKQNAIAVRDEWNQHPHSSHQWKHLMSQWLAS